MRPEGDRPNIVGVRTNSASLPLSEGNRQPPQDRVHREIVGRASWDDAQGDKGQKDRVPCHRAPHGIGMVDSSDESEDIMRDSADTDNAKEADIVAFGNPAKKSKVSRRAGHALTPGWAAFEVEGTALCSGFHIVSQSVEALWAWLLAKWSPWAHRRACRPLRVFAGHVYGIAGGKASLAGRARRGCHPQGGGDRHVVRVMLLPLG